MKVCVECNFRNGNERNNMNYKEWSEWAKEFEELQKRNKKQRGCVFEFGKCFGILLFTAFRGFLLAFGAWVFLKMIGVTI